LSRRSTLANNNQVDVAEHSRNKPPVVNPWILAKIVDATLITGEDKRYNYDIKEVYLNNEAAFRRAVLKTNGAIYKAISISELSNLDVYYSYGVQKSTIPSTFAAVVIPVGTIVIAMATKDIAGKLLYIITNTQAIDGECP
jgi:hypothetical protein